MVFGWRFYDLSTGRPCVFIAIYNENERFPLLRKDTLTVEKGIEKLWKKHQHLIQNEAQKQVGKQCISGASLDPPNGSDLWKYRLCGVGWGHYVNTSMINITDTGPYNSNQDQSSKTWNNQGHHHESSPKPMTPWRGSADLFCELFYDLIWWPTVRSHFGSSN